MTSPARPQGQLTRVLSELSRDDPQAGAKLLPLVYEELRKLAHQKMRNEPPELTLDPTALVHEAYLRLVGDDRHSWDGRGHFFAAAAEAMRRILIERARKARQPKRGGDRKKLNVDGDSLVAPSQSHDDLVAIDEALRKLESDDPGRADVIKLRYFAGLTIDQTADVLGISPATVDRHWSYARTWMYSEIKRAESDP